MITLPELAELPPLAGVPTADLERLLEHGYARDYAKGTVVFEPGTWSFSALLIVRGELEIQVVGDGEARVVGRIPAGEIAGEAAFSDNGTVHTVRAVAARDTEALVVTQTLLDKARGTKALQSMQAHTVRVLADRIRATNATLRRAWEDNADEEPEALRAAIREAVTGDGG
ncbi:MAG: cyclic nucleotide-binding domain-containing protein [Proteobacteria bacterium]|nr:cyclic nucleotide-binding domain-containing protein [Pseudomonadota bacterium]MCP4917729.1 cyclic nucleotide-binding domain-containing protein [Pseudomonadota bacterium]